VEYFTLRNTAILGLAQVGVIVAGVLAAGACHKWYATFGLRPPSSTALLAEYGFLALVLPVVWVMMAVQALRRTTNPGALQWLAFPSGIVLLLVLLLGIGYAVVQPFLRLLGGF
jgi:hypothetical protein